MSSQQGQTLSQASEIKKSLQQIKLELMNLCQGTDINRSQERIIEWYTQPAHRIIKLLCFPLLKSLINVDYEAIYSYIEQDLINTDDEIQLDSLKILYSMPPGIALEVLKSKEKELLKILTNPEYNYERLICLHDFLMKAYMKNYALDLQDDCINQIINMYIKIGEQVFSTDRDITRDSIEIFINVFSDYQQNCTNFNSIDKYFDGMGSVKSLLKPLIVRLTNFFLPRLDQLLNKILMFELRLKSHLISLVVMLLQVIFDFKSEYFDYGLDEIKSSFLKQEYIIKTKNQVDSQSYKKDYNIILMNILGQSMTMLPSYKICVSMKILEIVSKDIKTQFNRYLTMTVCFYNLIDASLYYLSIGKKTCLYALFSQPWFIELKNTSNNIYNIQSQENNPLQISHELMASLIVATIYGKIHMKNKKFFHEVLQEVLDISYSIINWGIPTEKHDIITQKTILFTIDIYLILLEEAIGILDQKQLNLRLVELIKIINMNQVNFIPKIKSLYVICKNFDQYNIGLNLDFSPIFIDFTSFLMPPAQNSIFTLRPDNVQDYNQIVGQYVQNLEQIFVCMYYFSLKFDNEQSKTRQAVLQLIKEFKEYLNYLYYKNKLAERSLINSIQDFIAIFESYLENLEYNDLEQNHVDLNYIDMYIDQQDNTQKNVQLDQEPRDLMYISFNIISQGICKQNIVFESDFIDNQNPVHNLSSLYMLLQDEATMNHKYKLQENPVLITGISDFVQVHVSHATFIGKSLLSVNLNIVNITDFKVDNLSIRIYYTQGVDIFPQNANPKTVTIEELNANQKKKLNFSLNVETVGPLQISFGIFLQESKEIQIRTLPYKISLLTFILPNYINILSKQVFHYVWNDIANMFSVQCKLKVNFLDFWKMLKQKPFSCVILENNTNNIESMRLSIHNSQNQCINMEDGQILTVGMLGVTWDGISIAINVSGIASQNKQSVVSLEIKSTKKTLLEKIKNELDEFLQELTEGQMVLIN